MKLFLCSDGSVAIQLAYKHIDIPKEELKIGYITTATMNVKDDGYLHRNIKELEDNDFNFEKFDIVGKTELQIKDFINNKNVIHIEGGNTYYLLKHVIDTGFHLQLKQYINNGGIYIGTSASSYIMCPTIEMSDWGPDTHDRSGLTDLTALNYVPFLIKAHYVDEMRELIEKNLKITKLPVKILRDGEAIKIWDISSFDTYSRLHSTSSNNNGISMYYNGENFILQELSIHSA